MRRLSIPPRISIRDKQAQYYGFAGNTAQIPLAVTVDLNQEFLDRMAQRFREEHGELFQTNLSDPGVDECFRQAAEDVALNWQDPPLGRRYWEDIVGRLVSRYLGYGPLDTLLADARNTEIMVNRFDDIWVEQQGRMFRTGISFPSEDELFRAAQRMARRYGRELNRDHPCVDARLPDGSRIFAITAPQSVHGTILNIRRHPPDPYRGKDLIAFGMFSEEMLELFRLLVRGKATVLVTGAMGTGKTTVIQVVFLESGIMEHIVTIEDTDEMRLRRCIPNVVALQAQRRDEDKDDNGANMYALAIKALRMNVQRIIIGEIRAMEILAWRLAIESGHNGIWTSIHTRPQPERAIERAANLLAEAAGMPYPSAVNQVRGLVDVIVHVRRLPDGTRVVSDVTEVLSEGFNPVYQYLDGHFQQTGQLSHRLVAHIQDNGVEVMPVWRQQ